MLRVVGVIFRGKTTSMFMQRPHQVRHQNSKIRDTRVPCLRRPAVSLPHTRVRPQKNKRRQTARKPQSHRVPLAFYTWRFPHLVSCINLPFENTHTPPPEKQNRSTGPLEERHEHNKGEQKIMLFLLAILRQTAQPTI